MSGSGSELRRDVGAGRFPIGFGVGQHLEMKFGVVFGDGSSDPPLEEVDLGEKYLVFHVGRMAEGF